MESAEGVAVREAAEKAREARRALYLTYLARVDALRPMLIPPREGKPTRTELVEWWESYVDADRQVELMGHENVRLATGPVYTMLDAITEWVEPDPQRTITTRLTETHWEKFNHARIELIKAMRSDAAPPTS
jgi:hypothetical protein